MKKPRIYNWELALKLLECSQMLSIITGKSQEECLLSIVIFMSRT